MGMESRKRYEYKRLLDELSSKKGHGTELISVYVTPGLDLGIVVNQLREEQGTAVNIKSKSTRKNVVSALDRIINFLQKYMEKKKKAPENGMAIFSGNVAEELGASDIQLYWIEPPEPVSVRMYRCDQEFVTEPLRDAIAPKETVGLLAIDSKDAMIATLRGKNVNVARHLTSGVWGKHGRGGQSQRRFERLREIAVHDFMKRIAEVANREFSNIKDMRAIIVGGPGPFKDDFLKKELLYAPLREKVRAVIDIGYADEQGIKDLINSSAEVLSDLDVMKEKGLVQKFMTELVSDNGLAVYGEAEVRKHLEAGAVDTLLISEAMRATRVTVGCSTCDYKRQDTVTNLTFYERQISGEECPKCRDGVLRVLESKDIVKELCELADLSGANVEFISLDTEEGQQLKAAFKMLAAILRFKVS